MKMLMVAALFVVQGMPVTRLAGGVADQGAPPVQQPAPTRPVPRDMPVTQLDFGASAATLDSPRRLSLTFSEPRPLQEVLRLVVAGTPFSLAIDADVTGTFRGEFKQLTLRDALTTLLRPLGYEFDLHGTVLRITRHHTETREFDVDLLAGERGLARTSGAPGALVSTTVAAADAFAGIADGVQALLSPSGTVHVDRRAGLVQATDYPERLDRVAQYLETLQLRSGRQVRLQARVFEVTLTDATAIDWRAVRAKLGLPGDAAEAGLAADPSALQTALAAQGEIRVLSAPEVTTLNNEPALVRAAMPGVSSLTLTVVPQIAGDGIVQLSVSHAWEELAAGEKSARVAEGDTVMRVMDGHTVLLSGWLRPAQIAVASPGVGSLFGGPATKTVPAELVVLLSATVVAPGYR
jgi:type II secretory pathway component GspD/PulD (secretin)